MFFFWINLSRFFSFLPLPMKRGNSTFLLSQNSLPTPHSPSSVFRCDRQWWKFVRFRFSSLVSISYYRFTGHRSKRIRLLVCMWNNCNMIQSNRISFKANHHCHRKRIRFNRMRYMEHRLYRPVLNQVRNDYMDRFRSKSIHSINNLLRISFEKFLFFILFHLISPNRFRFIWFDCRGYCWMQFKFNQNQSSLNTSIQWDDLSERSFNQHKLYDGIFRCEWIRI